MKKGPKRWTDMPGVRCWTDWGRGVAEVEGQAPHVSPLSASPQTKPWHAMQINQNVRAVKSKPHSNGCSGYATSLPSLPTQSSRVESSLPPTCIAWHSIA